MAHFDKAYLVLLLAALLLDHFVLWPRFVRAASALTARARLTLWAAWMTMLWLLAVAALVVWSYAGRTWSALGLSVPDGWRLVASAAVVLAVIALYAPSIAKLARMSPARQQALRARFGAQAALLPHTRFELGCFVALSITAGICEEVVFRGYLLRALQGAAGLWPAAGISCVTFALAHAYQGASGILKTGIVGTVLMAMVLAFDSLVPAIVVHALIDVGQGVVSWLVLRDGPAEREGGGSGHDMAAPAEPHAGGRASPAPRA